MSDFHLTYFFRVRFVRKPVGCDQEDIRVWFSVLDLLIAAAHDTMMEQLEQVLMGRYFSLHGAGARGRGEREGHLCFVEVADQSFCSWKLGNVKFIFYSHSVFI